MSVGGAADPPNSSHSSSTTNGGVPSLSAALGGGGHDRLSTPTTSTSGNTAAAAPQRPPDPMPLGLPQQQHGPGGAPPPLHALADGTPTSRIPSPESAGASGCYRHRGYVLPLGSKPKRKGVKWTAEEVCSVFASLKDFRVSFRGCKNVG